MSTKLKLIIGIAASIIALFLLFFIFKAFTKRNSEPIKLSWWGFEDEEEQVKPLIDGYKQKNPNVSIIYKKIETKTPGEYEKEVTDALASGEGPDIFQVRNDWIPKHYKKLSPMPNSAYSNESFSETFFEVAKNDLTFNDKLYAIPFSIDTLALFYNTKAFGDKSIWSPPETWSDVTSDVSKLKTLNGAAVNTAGISLGTAYNVEHSQDILYLLMLQNSTKMVSNDQLRAQFNISTKDKNGNIIYPGTAALDFYTSFANPAKENYTWQAEMPNSLDAFISGKTNMFLGYASDIRKIEKVTDKLNFNIAEAPQFSPQKIFFARYFVNGVSKDSKNQDEAWKFLKFASSKDQLKKYLERTGLPTARKDLEDWQSNRKYMAVFTKQTEKAQTWYVVDWDKTDQIFKDLINNVTTGKQPSQAAIDKASEDVTTILQDFKTKEK